MKNSSAGLTKGLGNNVIAYWLKSVELKLKFQSPAVRGKPGGDTAANARRSFADGVGIPTLRLGEGGSDA